MSSKPDHPHQAAVYLMKALHCCNDCHQATQADLIQVQQLTHRKQLLAEQLKTLSCHQPLSHLNNEIQELQTLVTQLTQENEQAATSGKQELLRMDQERQEWELEQRQQLIARLEEERILGSQLTAELESLMQRIQALTRANNEIISNFTAL